MGVSLFAPVVADVVVAVVGKGMGRGVEGIVVGDHRTALAAGDGLDRVKRKASHGAEGPQGFSLKGAAHGLAGVLDEDQPVLVAESGDGVDLRHGTAHVYRHHRFGSGGAGRFQAVGIQAKGFVDFGKDRHGPGRENRLEGGHEGKGRHDDLVAGPDAAGRQGDAQGRRAAGAQVAVGATQTLGQLLFKGPCFPVAVSDLVEAVPHEDAGVQHVLNLRSFFIREPFETRHDLPPCCGVAKQKETLSELLRLVNRHQDRFGAASVC